MAIDVSLKGVSGGDAACGWAVVQVDYDKEEEPVYAISGTMRAELEVQSTIKRGRAMGFYHDACKLDWSLHHPH